MMLKDSCISKRRFKATILTGVVISIALLAFFQWDIIGDQRYYQSDAVSSSDCVQSFIELPSSTSSFGPPPSPQDFSASNSTLGFNGIVAVSRGTPWRAQGLIAAAKASNISVQIPEQPVWSKSFIKSFELFGPVDAHGAAMAWLALIDVLKFITQNRWGSALVLGDDVDWSVKIREQTRKVAKAVVELTEQKAGAEIPYGLDWDVIWMGHCGDPPDFKHIRHVTYKDPTVLPFEKYRNINKHVITQLKQGQRAVHFSVGPICTWAYAVSANGAHNLLAEASEGHGGAYDLMLMNKCKSGKLRCIRVNMELFDSYHPAEGDQSEVRAGDSGANLQAESAASRSMGHTDNVLESARCAGLYNSTCT